MVYCGSNMSKRSSTWSHAAMSPVSLNSPAAANCPTVVWFARQRQREIRLAIVGVGAADILDDAATDVQRHGLVVGVHELEPDHRVGVLRPFRVDAYAVTVDELARFGRFDLLHCR